MAEIKGLFRLSAKRSEYGDLPIAFGDGTVPGLRYRRCAPSLYLSRWPKARDANVGIRMIVLGTSGCAFVS